MGGSRQAFEHRGLAPIAPSRDQRRGPGGLAAVDIILLAAVPGVGGRVLGAAQRLGPFVQTDRRLFGLLDVDGVVRDECSRDEPGVDLGDCLFALGLTRVRSRLTSPTLSYFSVRAICRVCTKSRSSCGRKRLRNAAVPHAASTQFSSEGPSWSIVSTTNCARRSSGSHPRTDGGSGYDVSRWACTNLLIGGPASRRRLMTGS